MRQPSNILCTVLAILLACASLVCVSEAGYLQAKAHLAQQLMVRSFERGGAPWPAADFRPAARLTIAAIDLDVLVLDAASPRALAFGPGVHELSAGGMTLAGHRDTHFAPLQHAEAGMIVNIDHGDDRIESYRIVGTAVFDSRHHALPASADLTLVTCYPFNAIAPGTPMRFVVQAERVVI